MSSSWPDRPASPVCAGAGTSTSSSSPWTRPGPIACRCYGRQDLVTPTLDTFAARGVRFEKCYAQTPLTLPSHTTLMTGTLPLFHGIRDNGGFIVPQKLETMAELFKGKGLRDLGLHRRLRPRFQMGPEPGIRHLLRQVRPEQVQEDLPGHGPEAGQRDPGRSPPLARGAEGQEVLRLDPPLRPAFPL